jgi:hypothetical protein
MFRGDSYDGRSLEVQASYDSSFNFACYGTTISKLHFLRHTSAAMGVAAFPVAQRQAILRMLAGDYCGNGYQFTLQGHPIRIGFDKAAPRPVTEVGLGSAKSLDAMWKKDGTGASCIGAPRLSDEPGPVSSDSIDTLVTKIQDYCKEKERPIPPQCEASRWERAKLGDMGTDYLVSANLFSVPAP